MIREETREGKELVEYVLAVLRDEKANAKLRLEAATWLSDRAWGKPVQVVGGEEGAEPIKIVLRALRQDASE